MMWRGGRYLDGGQQVAQAWGTAHRERDTHTLGVSIILMTTRMKTLRLSTILINILFSFKPL